MTYTVSFDVLPTSLEELKMLPQASLQKPEEVAALTVAALCAYPASAEACCAMLDYLRGPRPMSPMDKQFLRDRFMDGKGYVPRSYFKGAVPDNDYTPSRPFTVELSDSAATFAEAGYKRFDIRSGGADSPRQVTLRCKESTGQWFLWDQMLLAGIREPKSADPWA